jgi:putative transposase
MEHPLSRARRRHPPTGCCGTSNDNPFSESHFKTLKYQPRFPKRFGCIEDAKTFCRRFFDWYNQDHHHSGIGLMTPDQVHYGQSNAVHAARQVTLDQAFGENPGQRIRYWLWGLE